MNNSTRLTYSTADENAAILLDEFSLRSTDYTDDEMGIAMKESENAMIESIGYSENEAVYAIKSIGITAEDLTAYEENIVSGQINIDKLLTGEEIIFAVPESSVNLYTEFFKTGTQIPLSDVVLSDEEDMYDFNQFIPDENIDSVKSYSIGKRKDITTNIGAIISVSSDDTITTGSFSVICSDEAFSIWGLQDIKYTKVCIELSEDVNTKAADSDWYQKISACKGIFTNSTINIQNEISAEYNKIMCFYFLIIITLVITGTTSIGIIMNNKIRMLNREAAPKKR